MSAALKCFAEEQERNDECLEEPSSPKLSLVRHSRSLRKYGFEPHSMADSVSLFDMNLLQEPYEDNLSGYYQLCKATSLMVTLSCFSVWSKNRKTNGFGKVIPCVPSQCRAGICSSSSTAEVVRVFFFDDNIDLNQSTADCSGICNLRNVRNGQFVDFSEGTNGFRRERAGRHTLVHSSSDFQVVLVQANILDAMEDDAYFSKIIATYAEPHEKVLVYMDVNSTIVCVDTVTGKSMTEILLGTMFEFIEFQPKVDFTLAWEDRKPVTIDRNQSLKSIVKLVAKDDPFYYRTFYERQRCMMLFEELRKYGDMKWHTRVTPLEWEEFDRTYDEYSRTMQSGATDMGITKSWFKFWDNLCANKHAVCLNSFGIDTRKVVSQTVKELHEVMHVTINFKLWSEADRDKFGKEYDVKCPVRGDTAALLDAETKQQMMKSASGYAVN